MKLPITRRFDDLGRIAIPREIRKAVTGTHNNEGMQMDISFNNDGVILRLHNEQPYRGEWIRISDRPKSYIRRCSLCERDSYICFSEKNYNYCPWCGAKMDGGCEE